jgi:hypothetical protein
MTETKQNKERDEVLKRMLKMKPKPHKSPAKPKGGRSKATHGVERK